MEGLNELPLLSTPERVPAGGDQKTEGIGVIINEVQLLLAEKRTSLATMRTGIAVFVLPLSVLSLLIATSKYYETAEVAWMLLPLLASCAILATLGGYLIVHALIRIRRYDHLISSIKQRYSQIAQFLD